LGIPLDDGQKWGPQHMAWVNARAEDLRDDLNDYFKSDWKTDSDELRKQTFEHIGATHAHDATLSMLDDPKIAALDDARSARKDKRDTPNYYAPPANPNAPT